MAAKGFPLLGEALRRRSPHWGGVSQHAEFFDAFDAYGRGFCGFAQDSAAVLAQVLRKNSGLPLTVKKGAALMAHSKTEFELKLVGPARDVAAVPSLAWLDPMAAAPGEWERLTSTYVDSAALRLNAAGLSFRIREQAGTRTLTAKKAAPAGGAILRLETERRLAPGETDFLTGVAEIDDIIGLNAEDLAPIARTVTDRWSRLVEFGGALIEVSAEIGRAENLTPASLQSPLAEVELELMKGDAAALFALAKKLIEAFDGRLRPGVRSKLNRALHGDAPLWSKPPKLAVAESAVAADILAASLRQIAVRIIEAAALASDFHDSDAARRLRVALRRLRALERVFRGSIGDDALKSIAGQAQAISRQIGALRDLDVFIEKSLPLARGDAASLAPWRGALECRRAAQWNDAALMLSGRSFSAYALDILAAAFLEPWRTAPSSRLLAPARLYADQMLERRWRRLVEAGAAADFDDPRLLHTLRLDLKKFRYAAQFFKDLYPRESRKPFFAGMSALQDAFGEVNDAVVAQEIAAGAGEGFGAAAAHAAGFIAGYKSAEASAAAASIHDIWRAFAGAPPYWREEPPIGVP